MATVIFGSDTSDVTDARAGPPAAVLAAIEMLLGIANKAANKTALALIEAMRFNFPPGMVSSRVARSMMSAVRGCRKSRELPRRCLRSRARARLLAGL